jgi:hypothetical protein
MEGIPIYYVMQPSVDDSLNVFFLPPNLKSQSDVKIQDVANNFPHRNNGKFYHFRFYALCDKDQKTWVDISNLQAKAPVVDNRILVKILELSQPHHTKIFASVNGAKNSTPNGQRAPEQSQTQTQRPAQTDNRPRPQAQSQPQTQQQQQVKSPPHTTSQRPATNNQTSTPTTKPSQAAHEFDLLGGGDDIMDFSATTTTTTKTSVQFSSPPQTQTQAQSSKPDNSHLDGMSRAEIGAYKQQQMDLAIQDKLDFAKKMWQDEQQNNQDKEQAYGEVEDLIKKWSGKDNQRNNIRALLCTLQDVVWAEAGWNSLSFSDLMQPAQIKKNYFKAITRFHPDKNQTADYRQRYIAERVTNELNAAWDEFRKTNP